MRRRTGIALAAAFLSAGRTGVAAAQVLRVEAIPQHGPRAEWFAPPGWRVAHEARGDLNRDGRADVALHLVPADFSSGRDSVAASPAAHGLVVLLAERGSGLRRAGFTTVLLPRAVPRYALELQARRQLLVVRQRFGDRVRTELTHRFRHDPALDRFVLIGRDQHLRRQEGDWEVRSDDYRAGVRRVTTGGRSASGRSRRTTRREAIPRAKVLLEHVVETAGG